MTSSVAVGTFPPALQEDLDNARKWRTAYSFYSQRLTLRGQFLGIAVVVLSAVTGTAIFASIGESPDDVGQGDRRRGVRAGGRRSPRSRPT